MYLGAIVLVVGILSTSLSTCRVKVRVGEKRKVGTTFDRYS